MFIRIRPGLKIMTTTNVAQMGQKCVRKTMIIVITMKMIDKPIGYEMLTEREKVEFEFG